MVAPDVGFVRLQVVSKHHGDKQHIWESSADGNFAVSEDNENEPLGHGTLIKIHFKVACLLTLTSHLS